MHFYKIEEMNISELESSLSLVEEVFMKFEAPDYSEEGVKSFLNFIEINSISKLIIEGILRIFVCKYNDVIIGVVAIKNISHISMLFVNEKFHGQGIGKKLFKEVIRLANEKGDITAITLNSSPYAVEFYHKLGFVDEDEELVTDGIRYTPMKLIL